MQEEHIFILFHLISSLRYILLDCNTKLKYYVT